jgi:hypothetical protein
MCEFLGGKPGKRNESTKVGPRKGAPSTGLDIFGLI